MVQSASSTHQSADSFRCRLQVQFRQEIELLKACAHENVVGFKAACLDAPCQLLMVMEVTA